MSTYGSCPRAVNTDVQNDTCNFTGRAGYSGEPTRPVNTACGHTGSVYTELKTKQDDVVASVGLLSHYLDASFSHVGSPEPIHPAFTFYRPTSQPALTDTAR